MLRPLVYIAAVLAAFILFREFHVAEKLGLAKSNLQVLQQKAKEINSRTPVAVDDSTTLLAMDVASDGVTFRYQTTAAISQGLGGEQFINQMKLRMLGSACGDPNVSTILKNGFSVSYSYVDADSKPIGLVFVPTHMCK